ncbi:MAG: nicotinate-nucleotide adenylyltransferase [Chlamydiota bacterium]|nr:nicotinate-nucleotide adenylyltransferase [Chlamydiota bacterium]
MKVGLLGGTFDPIHLGHLIAAESAREQVDLERIVFVPSFMPPHKKNYNITPCEIRLEMVRLAIREEPFFDCSAIEIERQGMSYTVDTLKALHAANPDWELFFIIGADMLADIHMWKNINEIPELCQIVCVTREGVEQNDILQMELPLPEKTKKALMQNIVSMPPVGIASSQLRECVRTGKTIRYCVPDAVLALINEKGLYQQ